MTSQTTTTAENFPKQFAWALVKGQAFGAALGVLGAVACAALGGRD